MILERLFSQSELLIVALFLVMFAIVIYFLMMILRHSQSQNTELISTMRDSYEKQMYMMNDRLTASMDRWRDVNHLLLGSQVIPPSVDRTKRVHYASFLKANGVSFDDLEPDRQLVFVLTPFNNRFDDVFETIARTCSDIGLKCYRGDEQFLQGDILPHILKLLCQASVVIANIGGRNANVFYELGLAHAMDKNTILVSKTVETLPIDIKSKRVIVYTDLKTLKRLLKDELLKLAYVPKTVPRRIAAEPAIPSKADEGEISDRVLRLADEYLTVSVTDWRERVQKKNAIINQLAETVLNSRISKQSLATQENEGLIAALAGSILSHPEPGDMELLIEVADRVQSMHLKYTIVLSVSKLFEESLVPDNLRMEIEALLKNFEIGADKALVSRIRRTRYLAGIEGAAAGGS